MVEIIPIAIAILRCNNRYLFIKRRKPPYENLWSMIGGKIRAGEHIHDAAVREIMEETGSNQVLNYQYRGIVSERLVDADGALKAHFLIFVGYAEIIGFENSNTEGNLALFSQDEIDMNVEYFIPSDLRMFESFRTSVEENIPYEVELVQTEAGYNLAYYRKGERKRN